MLAMTLAGATLAAAPLWSQATPAATERPQSRDVLAATPERKDGTIRGRVVDAAGGQPIPGVRIQLPSRTVPDVFTDEDGRFTLGALPPDRYLLVASKVGYVTTWRRDRRTSGDYHTGGPPIDVAPGQVVEQIELAMSKGGVVNGRVIDNRGREVIGAQVFVYRSRWRDGQEEIAPTGWAADQTNDLGEFRLFGLPAGTYLLGVRIVKPAADGLFTVYYPGSFRSDEAQPVVARPGEELSTTIVLPALPATSLVGIVRHPDGQPEQRGTVSARLVSRDQSREIGTNTRPDGSYRLSSLEPGEYVVSAFVTGAGTTAQDARRFATARVLVDQKDVFVPLTLSAGGTMLGRYRFESGVPPAAMTPSLGSGGVTPVVLPHEDARRVTIAADWSFAITGLNGAYRLTPPVPPGWFVKRITRDGRDVTYVPVETAGETIEGIEVLLTQTTTHLAVSIEGSDAELDQATVLIFPEDESKLWFRSPFMRVVRLSQRRSNSETLQWVDRESFTMSALPPGRYYAVAIASIEEGQETNPALRRQLSSMASRFELDESATRTLALKVNPHPLRAP